MFSSVEELRSLISYKTSRSGGKGGQNVNKVSTKAELNLDFESCPNFSEEERVILREKLGNRMTAAGMVQVICETERSQLLNKEKALEKLMMILKTALFVQKPRKATKPKKQAVENRLKEKQQKAMKKLNRRKDFF